ncbi:MAG: hypothetical protein PGN16_04230 [Sphingomonas phyllosphaerae]|uniref:hypothetical protein n=1 Tax=Sphingomonas phyllosphaerae TaxID=257003 RepID=UPI002FF45F31
MKTFTNHTAGSRGINLKGGGTRWIEPGETVEIDPDTIDGKLPDFGKPASDAGVADEIDTLRARVETLEAENADLRAQLEAASAADGTKGNQPDAELIRAAVERLNVMNDDHWTAAGLPDVSAVSEAMGTKVTRAQIEAAAPDAKRPA